MTVTKVVRKSSDEVPRNVVNHQGRGDSRPHLTEKGIKAYDEMTLEEVRARAEAEFADAAVSPGTMEKLWPALDVFLKNHPAYAVVDARNDATSKKNSDAMIDELHEPEMLAEMKRGGRAIPDARAPRGWRLLPNYWDTVTAYSRACEKGKVTLDQGQLHKQRCAALEAQISSSYSEDEAYSMDMQELRRRCTPGSYDPLGPQ